MLDWTLLLNKRSQIRINYHPIFFNSQVIPNLCWSHIRINYHISFLISEAIANLCWSQFRINFIFYQLISEVITIDQAPWNFPPLFIVTAVTFISQWRRIERRQRSGAFLFFSLSFNRKMTIIRCISFFSFFFLMLYCVPLD